MQKVTNDYEADMEFGRWLRAQRVALGLTIEQAAEKTAIASSRLKSLEVGYAEKGITKAESEKLCALYRIDLKEFLRRASAA